MRVQVSHRQSNGARSARIAGLGMATLTTALIMSSPTKSALAQEVPVDFGSAPVALVADEAGVEGLESSTHAAVATSEATVADADACDGAEGTPSGTGEPLEQAEHACGPDLGTEPVAAEAQVGTDDAPASVMDEATEVTAPDVARAAEDEVSVLATPEDRSADPQAREDERASGDVEGRPAPDAVEEALSGESKASEDSGIRVDRQTIESDGDSFEMVASQEVATVATVSVAKPPVAPAVSSVSSKPIRLAAQAGDRLANWKAGHWATHTVGGRVRRYWVGADGSTYKGGLIDPTWGVGKKKAGFWAFASPKTGNAVITTYATRYKGKRVVFLADTNGRLYKQRGGWLVTGKLDGGRLHRYYIDPELHAAVVGYHPTEGKVYAHYTLANKGYVIRSAHKIGKRVYVADNEGRLIGGSTTKKGRWIVTGKYTGGKRQRYYVKNNSCPTGLFVVRDAAGRRQRYYGTKSGYVLRGTMAKGSGRLLADNDGKLAWGKGWLTSDAYSGTSQKYYLGSLGNGFRGAKVGLLEVGGKHYYGREDTGYIVRNGAYAISKATVKTGAVVDTKVAVAGKNGVLLTRAEVGQKVVAAVRSQLGCSYSTVDNGYFPGNSFNCSGLSWWAWHQAGVTLPHNQGYYSYYANQVNTTNSQMWSVESLGNWKYATSQLQPGDLVFFSPIYDKWHTGHVGVYIGGGQMIDSNTTGVLVRDVARSTFVGGGLPVTIVS